MNDEKPKEKPPAGMSAWNPTNDVFFGTDRSAESQFTFLDRRFMYGEFERQSREITYLKVSLWALALLTALNFVLGVK